MLFFIVFNHKYFINYKISNIFKIILVAILLYVIVIYMVTILRDIYFNGMNIFNFKSVSGVSGVSGVFLGLIVDRWIGLEGVSYPFKSFDAFINNPKIGNIDIYQMLIIKIWITQNMLLLQYQEVLLFSFIQVLIFYFF